MTIVLLFVFACVFTYAVIKIINHWAAKIEAKRPAGSLHGPIKTKPEKLFVVMSLAACLIPLIVLAALFVGVVTQATTNTDRRDTPLKSAKVRKGQLNRLTASDPASAKKYTAKEARQLSKSIQKIASSFLVQSNRLNWDFVTSFPSKQAEKAGILPGLVGTLLLMIMTAFIALPLGVGAAVFLEEYANDNWFFRLVEVNIANLAGVPSVVYGILGLGLFMSFWSDMSGKMLAAAVTLSLLILPVIIIATREALKTVPHHLREASLGLGGSRWRTIRMVVLPMALPGIMTGAILSLSRAIGETAPLIVIGAVTATWTLPEMWPISDLLGADTTALPMQIYDWVGRPQEAYKANAAAGIIVLIGMLLVMNGIAIFIRNRKQIRYA